jgi:hypothetical protein
MTLVINSKDEAKINLVKEFALRNDIDFGEIESEMKHPNLAMPGNPINNLDLEKYINESIASGSISIEDYKMKKFKCK